MKQGSAAVIAQDTYFCFHYKYIQIVYKVVYCTGKFIKIVDKALLAF